MFVINAFPMDKLAFHTPCDSLNHLSRVESCASEKTKERPKFLDSL